MRWKAFSVVAVAVVVVASGCASSPGPVLPSPVSPPISGFTQEVVGSPATFASVYGCATSAGTMVWASIDDWPDPTTSLPVTEVVVNVYLGYRLGTINLGGATQLGGTTLTRLQPADNAATIAPGQCFTVIVEADNEPDDTQAGSVVYTLNW